MHRPARPPPSQRGSKPLVQAGGAQGLGEQDPAGLGNDPGSVSGHHEPGMSSDIVHVKDAFRTGVDRSLDKPYSPSSKEPFVSKRSSPRHRQAKALG